MVATVLFGSFVLFLVLSVPVGISLGLASMITILYSGSVNIDYLVQSLVTTTDSFPIMALPFFILAGELMGKGGITNRILKVANMIFGKFTGGLALVVVAACMFFAAISGSGPATVAAIGGMMVPEMVNRGYDRKFASALVATAGSIGVIIPPSIPMIVYGVSANVSISTMFLAGFVPGIIIGLGLMVFSYIISRRKGYTGHRMSFSIKELLISINEAKWALLAPFIILGGIYGGIFTPTEAAATAVIYGLVVGVFVYRDLKISDLYGVMKNSALTTATVMIVVGTASTFGRILTIEGIPGAIANAIVSFSNSPIVIIMLINILLLFVGCFMDTSAAIIILVPILLPIVYSIGIDPIHFGIMMVVNLSIGFLTPPLGVNLFVACGISKISLEEITKGVLPFLAVMIFILMLITYIPYISLSLPMWLAK